MYKRKWKSLRSEIFKAILWLIPILRDVQRTNLAKVSIFLIRLLWVSTPPSKKLLNFLIYGPHQKNFQIKFMVWSTRNIFELLEKFRSDHSHSLFQKFLIKNTPKIDYFYKYFTIAIKKLYSIGSKLLRIIKRIHILKI